MERGIGGLLSVSTTGHYLPLTGRLKVTFVLVPPTAHRRDLDNHLKAAQDALTHAGFWRDDGQVDDLRIVRGAPDQALPRLEVTVTVLHEMQRDLGFDTPPPDSPIPSS